MSKLTEALEKIDEFLSLNIPKQAHNLARGIKRDLIQEKVKQLPFEISNEVYELYEWHNGYVDSFIFNNYDFLSFEAAFVAYDEWLSEIHYNKREESYWFEKSFPIFENWANNGIFLTVVCENSNYYPIRMLDDECRDLSIRYDSLTDLMCHVAHWYELAEECEEDRWEVKIEKEWILEAKYMTKQYIIDRINDRQTYPLQKEIYRSNLS